MARSKVEKAEAEQNEIVNRATDDANRMLETYKEYRIVDVGEYEASASALKDIKAKYSEIEAMRKKITKPLDESKKQIMEMFRRPLSALETAENCIKKAILVFQQNSETHGAETPKVAGMSKRTTWKAKVIDDKLVPREFLMVNEQALNAFAVSTKGTVTIAGVEFYSEDSIASSK